MAQDVFSKGSAATETVSLAPPPTFTANMLRDGAIGALISVMIGIVVNIVQVIAFPSLNLNQWMIDVLVKIATGLDPKNGPLIGGALGGLLGMPITTDPSTPLSILQYFYAAFLSFPANVGWFLGGFLVGFLRIRAGRDEGNLKGGWDTFWYGMISVEIPFLVFGVLFLFTSIIPGLVTISGFAGSILLYFLLFFLMPNFWLSLIFALLGSLVGSSAARKK